MKIFITGAAGYIGSKLSLTLADRGHEIHAMVRSIASEKWLMHPNIKVFKGDVLDKESLLMAMKGCDQVYHVAGKAGTWAKDASVFYKVNVEGTRNILDAAIATGVRKMVFTSACGVLGPTRAEPLEEEDERIVDFALDYDRSKKLAEELIAEYVKDGMNVVIVSPAKVYGPGHISHALMLNAIINNFLKKRITVIPAPGTYCVGFVYIDDIVSGHILAMEKGKTGETYILGGTNLSHYEFFDRLRILSSCKGYILMVPKRVVKAWAHIQELKYKLWGTPVMLTAKSVDHLFSHYTFSSKKAIRDLGYKITPLDEALQKTIYYLKQEAEV